MVRSIFVVLIEAEIFAVKNRLLTVDFGTGDKMTSAEVGKSSDLDKCQTTDTSEYQEVISAKDILISSF